VLKFNQNYLAIAILLLLIEVLIAIFVHDKFIRPYFGDFLVVILIYCFLKSFVNLPVWSAAFMVLVFSFAVEIGQYFNMIGLLGLQHSAFARTVIGNSFAWIDLMAYVAGILSVVIIEKVCFKH
jgi:hypothetical protein